MYARLVSSGQTKYKKKCIGMGSCNIAEMIQDPLVRDFTFHVLNLTGKGALNASKKPGRHRGRQKAEFHAMDGTPAVFFANILCRHHGLEGSERDAVLAACFLNSIGCSAYVTEAVMKFGGAVPAVETIVRCVNALREKSSGRTFPDDYTKAEVVALLSDVIEKQRRLLLMEFKTSMTSMNMAA